MVLMADVWIVVWTVIGILLTFPGLAVALNLLLPKVTDRAYLRLAYTPVWSFVVGAPIAVVAGLLTVGLLNAGPAPLKAIGGGIGIITLGVYGLGAAGLVRFLGERAGEYGSGGSHLGNLIRGALIYELAAFVPILGWFVFFPLALTISIGAAAFALIGWAPRQRADVEEEDDEEVYETAVGQADRNTLRPPQVAADGDWFG